ncbi:MAG: hypothetical protein NTY15_05060, partial [Planctomycetota bacterium]|nr:hypothetical protein [Planctomycetota bacterium]
LLPSWGRNGSAGASPSLVMNWSINQFADFQMARLKSQGATQRLKSLALQRLDHRIQFVVVGDDLSHAHFALFQFFNLGCHPLQKRGDLISRALP